MFTYTHKKLQTRAPVHSFSHAGESKDHLKEQVSPLWIQTKLTIGAPDDEYEREADIVAEMVMQMPDSRIQRQTGKKEEEEEEKIQMKPVAEQISPLMQKQEIDKEEEPVQTKSASDRCDTTTHSFKNTLYSIKGSGQPLFKSSLNFFEPRFGYNFSQVRLHTDEKANQMNDYIHAKAFTHGTDIYFKGGQYNPDSGDGKQLLAHELTHTVQQADPEKIAAKANGITSNFIQRAIRTNGGANKINEKDYEAGEPKETVGSKVKVRDLIADTTKRIFQDTPEVEQYANGTLDYLGDVIPQNKKTYWYRLPSNDLTVLGEYHNNPEGNVEDIVVGLGTKRFMYEPFHEFKEIPPLSGSIGASANTKTALQSNEQKYRVGPLADYVNFNPALENIVIKAFTGVSMYKQFLGDITDARWASRKADTDYSFGERIALYFSFAIHIASDISNYTFPVKNSKESHYTEFGRSLQTYYITNKKILDAFSASKDSDNLIGIADMFKKFNSPEAKVYYDFADIFEKFAAGYIEELGATVGNPDLTKAGKSLFKKKTKDLDSFTPAREEIIKERVKIAKAGKYLIAGMGDYHHTNLTAWLDKNSIAHDEVTASLKKQEADVLSKWVP